MSHKIIGASLQDPRRIIIVDYCLMAFVTALPIYECITSFAREVEIMWSNGFRPKSTIVFYLNRFAMLNMAVMNLLGTLKWHAKAVSFFLCIQPRENMIVDSHLRGTTIFNIIIGECTHHLPSSATKLQISVFSCLH
ncbi:hypothetical protein IEO21_04946 [Rhodonia placenta]|uniref:DUF6533 domain-containing protein n=1 Tax=Rhodonia placenta TaxID=104341 RepID=A0A8H7P2W7_9APHY|nr:hypothetical protein IEO21_04946 [Postia placenta]